MKRVLLMCLIGMLINACHKKPKVCIVTPLGAIVCELYPDKAPATCKNFLQYVDEDRYKDAKFYRVVTLENQPANKIKIEVIQGGLLEYNHPNMLKPIVHETTMQTGIRHEDGTISMARLEPGSASSEFFICINKQPQLDFGGIRNPDGQGFSAFGKVIKGMEVVRSIQALGNTNQILNETVQIESIYRL